MVIKCRTSFTKSPSLVSIVSKTKPFGPFENLKFTKKCPVAIHIFVNFDVLTFGLLFLNALPDYVDQKLLIP